MLTKERLHELFEYREGVLYWKIDKSSRAMAGSIAGSINTDGYIRICLDSKLYGAHRIVFLMHHGYMPKCIDHVDRDRTNNHIQNLRDATKEQNQHNRKLNGNNKSGIKNVSWISSRNKWRAQINVDGKANHIGYFTELNSAEEAVRVARLNLHKEYANHG